MKTFIVITLLVATPAYAQDKTPEIDKIFSWVKPGMPGCLAAASQDGKLVVNRAYGLADIERNVPLTTESLIDAGSIRKQFVAAAVLLLVEEGRLSLTDDVRKYAEAASALGMHGFYFTGYPQFAEDIRSLGVAW